MIIKDAFLVSRRNTWGIELDAMEARGNQISKSVFYFR
jgi:hypothetical protein